MDFFVDFGCALQFIFWKLMKNIAVGTGTPFRDRKSQRLAHKPLNHGQPHQTAANQIMPKFFLDPHLTKCRWDIPVLGISTLCSWGQQKVDLFHDKLYLSSLCISKVSKTSRHDHLHFHCKTVWEAVNQSTAILSCIVMCDWLRALINLHCDIMIGMSMNKIWFSRATFFWEKIQH